MSYMGNPYQSRIGRVFHPGHALPETEAGDEIVVFVTPPHWCHGENQSVMISINLRTAQLTAAEARRMARALLHHANQSEEQK